MSISTFEEITTQLLQMDSPTNLDTMSLVLSGEWLLVHFDDSFSFNDGALLRRTKNGVAFLPFFLEKQAYVSDVMSLRRLTADDIYFLEKAKKIPLNKNVIEEIDSFIDTQKLRLLFKKENENI